MDLITIDFETFYSKDFSLSKMTTEEYIRSPEFETIGVSVKVGSEDAEWFSGTKEQTKKFLQKFDWGNAIAIAHNAMFDMAILNWQFDIRPKKIADTLSMARPIHGTEVGGSLSALVTHYGLGQKGTEVINALGKRRIDFTEEELAKYGEYCINDVELTYKLFCILVGCMRPSELNLIDLTIRMFTEPMLQLDKTLLTSHLKEVVEKKESLLAKALIDKDDLMSNPKLADVLKNLGVNPPMKISPTTGKKTFAFAKTDEEFKALLEHDNIMVQAIVAARLGVKSTLEETRTQRFINIADRGTLPIPLRYYAAHTGRWGGDDSLNLQNLPRGSNLKKSILAPEGYVVIDCDSSQIEARILAWFAGQEDLVTAFERGEDVYKQMASAIYNKPESDIDKMERFVGKTTILGSGYGMGALRFQAQLKNFGVELPIEECERIITVYRQKYAAIPALWRQANKAITAMMQNQSTPLGITDVISVQGREGIKLPNGLYLKYPNLRRVRSSDGNDEVIYDVKKGKATTTTKLYSGKLVENVGQALARIIIGDQMSRIAKKYRVVLTVHDAIACVAPEAEAEEARAYVEKCMRTRPDWAPDLPLNCESGVGRSYGEC